MREQSASISVMLIVSDADAAVAWYKDALGATELWNRGGVAGLEVDGAPFFLHEVNPKNPSETSPDRLAVTSVRIEVFVDDPDRFMERAIAAGASLGSELEDHQQPWGDTSPGRFSRSVRARVVRWRQVATQPPGALSTAQPCFDQANDVWPVPAQLSIKTRYRQETPR